MLRLPRSLPLLGSLVLFAAALGCAPEGADETSLEDVSARDALSESLPEGETLSEFGTWARYLRQARLHLKQQKNKPRHLPNPGDVRSAVPRDRR